MLLQEIYVFYAQPLKQRQRCLRLKTPLILMEAPSDYTISRCLITNTLTSTKDLRSGGGDGLDSLYGINQLKFTDTINRN